MKWFPLILFVGGALFAAEEEEKKNWTNNTELSAVWTGGNSEASTIGFKNEYTYNFEKAVFKLLVSGVRAESTQFNRTAVPDGNGGFTIIDNETTDVTAENYQFSPRYDKNIGEKAYWFAQAEWISNEPAGIDSRTSASVGYGNKWVDTEKRKFKTDYGLQYTAEDPVADLDSEDYLGLRLSYELQVSISENASFKQTMQGTTNFDESDDFLINLTNDLTSNISGRLALKVSLQLLYDNMPSFASVPVADGSGVVLAQLDDLDTVFTTSLVITY